MERLTDSRRARNSASVITLRRRPASRPSRRRCFLASSRVEPLTALTSSRASRTRTTVFGGSSAEVDSSLPLPLPERRRRRRRRELEEPEPPLSPLPERSELLSPSCSESWSESGSESGSESVELSPCSSSPRPRPRRPRPPRRRRRRELLEDEERSRSGPSSCCVSEVSVSSASSVAEVSSSVARPSSVRAPASKASSELPTGASPARSEEHTSELQSRGQLVCRLLLEKKNTQS